MNDFELIQDFENEAKREFASLYFGGHRIALNSTEMAELDDWDDDNIDHWLSLYHRNIDVYYYYD